MTTEQLDRIPEELLRESKGGCTRLIAWLKARGWHMSLLELERERARRGIRKAGRWAE